MTKKITRYTDDFKNTIVELYNSGKSLAELNREYGISKSTIQGWVAKATPEEENEIFKKAMAIFAKK